MGMVFRSLYFSKKSMENDPMIHAVAGTNEEVLVFGSSRAVHHYDPRILEDSLGKSCYNVGSGGQNIYYHLAILEATLERYIPDIAILELMTIDFEVTPAQWETEKLGVLLPFYHNSAGVKKAILRRGSSEKVKNLSSVYSFNSLLYTIFRNNVFPFDNHIKGYIPIDDREWKNEIGNAQDDDTKIDSSKMNTLFEFIQLCQSKKIQLHIFISPHYVKVQGDSKYKHIIENIKYEFGLEVNNFENHQTFLKDSKLFADPLHLNSKGAKKYSAIVSTIIKESAKKPE